MKNRLTRLDTIYADRSLYLLTFCTHLRQPILTHPSLHQSFRAFAEQARMKNIFVGRYVIMPDHIHLFAAFPEPHELSLWMKSLKNSLSKMLRALGIPAPHWQKGFHDHLMRGEESYTSKWSYVLDNPVRKGLVPEASLWPSQGEINPLPL